MQERVQRYAQLLVRAGAGLRDGQELLIDATTEHAALVAAMTEEAYKAGASYVDVVLREPRVRRALVAAGPEEALEFTPPWAVARLERAVREQAAVVGLSASSNVELYEDLDQDRLGRTRLRAMEKVWLDALEEQELAWCLAAMPTDRWAQEVVGEPDADKLWEPFAHALRLEQEDPAAAWWARMEELETRAAAMNERGFDALRYRGPGTDLVVGLIPAAQWLAGASRTRHGQRHIANLPTEEIFTTPDRNRADGRLRIRAPLVLRGGLVEGLELELRDGVIVGASATRGQELVDADLGTDEHARRLGEVALVDRSSRVGETGLIFRSTLFDENAAAHIAWGSGISQALPGLDAEARLAAGCNHSETHVDVIVGADDVEIDGVTGEGEAVPVLRGGDWVLSG